MQWRLLLPEPWDARQRRQPPPSTSAPTTSTTTPTPRSYSDLATTQSPWTSLRPSRPVQQFSFFLLSSLCVLGSVALTRRATVRKYLALRPAGLFTPSNYAPPASGAFDAAEALGLATLNVTSVGAMLFAGGMWAADVSSLEDLRGRVGRTMQFEEGQEEEVLDQEVEDFLPVLMARMTGKSEEEIAVLIREAQEQGKVKK